MRAITGSFAPQGMQVVVTGKLKRHDDVIIEDLPGICSLSPHTLEEVVSRNYLVSERSDAVLNIVDGTNFERNLYLTHDLGGFADLCLLQRFYFSSSFISPLIRFPSGNQIMILLAISRLIATRDSLTLTIRFPPMVETTVTFHPATNPVSSRFFFISGLPPTLRIMFSWPAFASVSGIIIPHSRSFHQWLVSYNSAPK